ncbi:MAG TPA: sigma 54-interacting transcriptional regulator [Candidatus Avanaerovorax faecigallinarum]|nr:sigma 54-interacting transcriptional regulator [Candidatus Avanaerovorax faecigallinarum]
MKKVIMIFSTNENMDAINYLHNQLENVFEFEIEIEDVFLDALNKNEKLEADAYLIVSEDILELLKNNISDFSRILIVRRAINKNSLSDVEKISDDETVLVVNDSVVSSLQTMYNLYELGFGNLNLVPFDETKPISIYEGIPVAITPDEEHLVPPGIGRIINIGYREISFDTMLHLAQLLDLENSRIYRNLILNSKTVTDSGSLLYTKYLQELLKSQALSRTVGGDNQAIILCSVGNQIIYMNPKAEELIGVQNAGRNIESVLDLSSMTDGDYAQAETEISGDIYSVDKSPVKLMTEIIGFSYTLSPYVGRSESSRNGMFARYTFGDIIHRSEAMDRLIDMAKDISKTDYTVSITGESGTGKEMFAQSIHNYSLRKDKPFVAINCAALTDSLLDSELFGYEKGSFTGADSHGKIGLFEQAHGGTIFLDEIGDISPHMQLRLLRALQEKQIMKVGGTRLIDIDVRVIAATNKNLEEEVMKGNFRDDLFYRLNVIPLHVPPLRERKEDVLPLFRYFVGDKFADLTEEEKEQLTSSSWPGNIRQLENVATYYCALSSLPPLITDEKKSASLSSGEKNHIVLTETELSEYVLNIISDNSLPYHGIGRGAILDILRSYSINIGEGKLREILRHLSSRGLIDIRKGRTGSVITDAGRAYLQEHSSYDTERHAAARL